MSHREQTLESLLYDRPQWVVSTRLRVAALGLRNLSDRFRGLSLWSEPTQPDPFRPVNWPGSGRWS